MTITYGGPDVVKNVGNGNYYPVNRDSWYPTAGFGEYATYDLTLRTPKGLTTPTCFRDRLLIQPDRFHERKGWDSHPQRVDPAPA